MIKVYQKYLISSFFKTLCIVFFIFFSLIIILNIFEEVSYLKDTDTNLIFPFFLTLLNSPSIVYETFPFIFFITTQFLFIKLMDREELDIFKKISLSNFKLIGILSITAFIISLFLITIFYNLSSNLKFIYLEMKNKYAGDNKYLAIVTENGLWIKDEIDQRIYIISAQKIEENYLKEVSISEFDEQFDLIQTFLSDKVDISKMEWIILKPTLSKDNENNKLEKNVKIKTHFNLKKINGLFRNLSSLNIIQLINQKNDYKSLGYSTNEIESHLYKIYLFPIFLSIMTVLSSIIMINTNRNKTITYHIILGIFLSVLIYYLYYLFNLLGQNGKIPILLSAWFPLFILSTLIIAGLIRINEK